MAAVLGVKTKEIYIQLLMQTQQVQVCKQNRTQGKNWPAIYKLIRYFPWPWGGGLLKVSSHVFLNQTQLPRLLV